MAPVVAGVALRVRDERIHAEGTCTHEDATGRLPLGIALDARVADRRAIDALARAFLARFDGAATGRAYDGQAGTGERAVIPSPVAIARSRSSSNASADARTPGAISSATVDDNARLCRTAIAICRRDGLIIPFSMSDRERGR